MESGATKKRGAVAPGKEQVNWRFRSDLLIKLEAERRDKGFKSKPAFLEHILVNRYYPEEKAGG
jgi:hypothetical protein